jgi:hypothetical protein
MTDEEIANLPDMEYGKPGDKKVEPVRPKKVKITRPDKTKIILEKQAFDKTFVKPAEVSKHTETLNFENNANIDKHFQVLDDNDSNFSQNIPESQHQEEEAKQKSNNFEFAMIKDLAEFIKEFKSSKQNESTPLSDSSCDSSETANCEKSELVDSAESSNE